MSVSLTARKPGSRYSIMEEIANAATHGLGALLAVAGTVLLLLKTTGDPWKVVSASIYGASMIILFTMSCLYHALANPKAKAVRRICDHATIYLLIAGTYTTFTLVAVRGGVGWTIFGVVWGAAIFGIILNAISIERFKVVSMICYIASGWCVIAAIGPLIKVMEPAGILLLVSGGVAYTAGLVFYALKNIRYMHSIWHLFVFAGAALHYLCILFYVM